MGAQSFLFWKPNSIYCKYSFIAAESKTFMSITDKHGNQLESAVEAKGEVAQECNAGTDVPARI